MTEDRKKIVFISVGGTIDKIYFDALSEYEVGAPQVINILREANAVFDYELRPLLRKDSLDMTDADRQFIRTSVEESADKYFIITHGTDTMVETARALEGIEGKTIVLTGSLTPAQFKQSDAEFNIGVAIGALQVISEGVYIAMNGSIFDPAKTVKNREENRFESIS